MKTIITHVRPHLDDLCAAWLVRKFKPGWNGAQLRFRRATIADYGRSDVIFVGMGRGKFDEHKGDVGESSASLVWRSLRGKAKNRETRAALDNLVAWVRAEDNALHEHYPDSEAGLSWQLYYQYERHKRSSAAAAAFGFELLENFLLAQQNRVQQEHAWKRRVIFMTPWGRAAGLKTDAGGMDGFAYRRGYALVVLERPRTGYRQFRASPESRVDLARVYEKLRQSDSRAAWFLHQSHKLLLSGSDVAPGLNTSRLPLNRLISYVRRRSTH